MTATVPTRLPDTLRAGDTWKWRRADLSSDYPPGSWTLTYWFNGLGFASAFSAEAVADAGGFLVTVSASDSAGYMAGTYQWLAAVDAVGSPTERYQIDAGTVEVLPDLATAIASFDGRSHARRVLEAIEAVIEGRASQDQQGYTINGRSLQRTPIPELLALRDRYKAEVGREDDADRVARGLGRRRKILTRFS